MRRKRRCGGKDYTSCGGETCVWVQEMRIRLLKAKKEKETVFQHYFFCPNILFIEFNPPTLFRERIASLFVYRDRGEKWRRDCLTYRPFLYCQEGAVGCRLLLFYYCYDENTVDTYIYITSSSSSSSCFALIFTIYTILYNIKLFIFLLNLESTILYFFILYLGNTIVLDLTVSLLLGFCYVLTATINDNRGYY